MPEKQSKERQPNQKEKKEPGKPDFVFIPKGRHEWRQQGYYLICKSCDLDHAVYIGPEKLMVGINKKGEPILKNRKNI